MSATVAPRRHEGAATISPWPVLALVAVNLVPLAGVLVLGWRLFDLMLLYWIENGIVGAFTLLKMLTARGPAPASDAPAGASAGASTGASAGASTGSGGGDGWVRSGPLRVQLDAVGRGLGRMALSAFFVFHYGTFWAVHGVFVFVVFGAMAFGGGPGGPGGLGVPPAWPLSFPFGPSPLPGAPGPATPLAVVPGSLALAVLSLVLSHGVSYVLNFLGRGEDRQLAPDALMAQPYARVVVLHLAILGGAFAAALVGAPVLALVLLVALKTGIDVAAHLRERRRAAVGAA